MKISFSMDGIKDMDFLYSYTVENLPEFGEVRNEKYCGDCYCSNIITDLFNVLALSDWKEHKYLGSTEYIGGEDFIFVSTTGQEYNISFAISTYNGKLARLEVMISTEDTEDYDHRLEKLKIALKDRLLQDWRQCTWLVDEQAAALCKTVYEKTFLLENNLRAFSSKILIHFLGVDWIRKNGLEKEAESVDALKEKFVQRVSEFDNINTDFLSMTLETLVKVMFDGIVYKDEIILNRQNYVTIQQMQNKGKDPGKNIADYIKNQRVKEKNIWKDLFEPYIEDPNAFKTAIHNFIEDRNHVAHSKVLSWGAYQIILQDFNRIENLIQAADIKFEQKETSDEVILMWEIEQDNFENEQEYLQQEYLRDRIATESGIEILDEDEIQEWFDEILDELYDFVYQRYHLDVCYQISNLSFNKGNDSIFTITSPAVEDDGAKIDIVAEYFIDDDLGADSCCSIVAQNGNAEIICKAEIYFHNGNGCEGEDGIMEATENTEYNTIELDDFREELIAAIEALNPYPEKLSLLSYENKGAVQYVADYPCEQCGKLGISIDSTFLTIGRCCYCGYEHELFTCARCGQLIGENALEHGLCQACAAYIDKQ